jgi:hypothetical protein
LSWSRQHATCYSQHSFLLNTIEKSCLHLLNSLSTRYMEFPKNASWIFVYLSKNTALWNFGMHIVATRKERDCPSGKIAGRSLIFCGWKNNYLYNEMQTRHGITKMQYSP